MALQCVAIIGKGNEPLYLADVARDASNPEEPETTNDGDGGLEQDIFGFREAAVKDSISLRHEFMMHASLDRLEELVGSQPRWRNRLGADSKWIGLLCPMEETLIYGYVTSTNIKILAMVLDTTEKIRHVHLKTLFAKVHNLYVEYTLNPFSPLQQRILSKRFDNGIREIVKSYNENSKGMSYA